MPTNWTVCDSLNRPRYLSDSDKCIYQYEYYSGESYEYENNQIVFNFKKPPDANGQIYKTEAVRHFAQLLIDTNFPSNSAITAAPTSKPSNSPMYDSRLEDVLKIFSTSVNSVPVLKCFDAVQETVPAHLAESGRSPKLAAQNIRLLNFNLPENIRQLFILDDVITTGSMFIAMKNLLLKNFPNLQIYGIFLAKAIRLNQ